MSNLPNLYQLARRARYSPSDVTSREAQVVNIWQDYEAKHPVAPSAEKTVRMADAVPALLAHIDELLGENENLRKYAETTKYHQDQHAAAVRELEKARFEVTRIAIDTSPAYAQLRDERDSARRERDEAMGKVETLSARRQEELDGLKAKCGQQADMLARHCKTRDEVLSVLDRFNTVPADDVIAETLIDSARNLLGGAR